ncbi:unnamed protein product [Coregonus sp. 'balchen']|nr:unnamed protein product [Coregonus sp. 'balchen']
MGSWCQVSAHTSCGVTTWLRNSSRASIKDIDGHGPRHKQQRPPDHHHRGKREEYHHRSREKKPEHRDTKTDGQTEESEKLTEVIKPIEGQNFTHTEQ